jgi:serine O-acetyltransferase
MRQVRQFAAAPLLLVYVLADRSLVLADAGRWAAIDREAGRCFDSPAASIGELLYILGKYPEYRSLFYFRASRSNIKAKIAARLAGILWRGAPGLLISGDIGPGLYIEHGFGTILAAEHIGQDCWVNQGVTIARDGAVVGDRVFLRMGCKVLPGVTISDDCEIGANAVVTCDIPSGCVALGVPARVAGPNPRLTTPDINASPAKRHRIG